MTFAARVSCPVCETEFKIDVTDNLQLGTLSILASRKMFRPIINISLGLRGPGGGNRTTIHELVRGKPIEPAW